MTAILIIEDEASYREPLAYNLRPTEMLDSKKRSIRNGI